MRKLQLFTSKNDAIGAFVHFKASPAILDFASRSPKTEGQLIHSFIRVAVIFCFKK